MVEEHVGDVVYQEYMLSPIILLHIYLENSQIERFCVLQSGGTPQFVNLQGGGTYG